MKPPIIIPAFILAMFLSLSFLFPPVSNGEPLSSMSGEEISRLLDQSSAGADVAPADMRNVKVSADDLLTKVYGCLDAENDRPGLFEEARTVLRLIPYEDETGLWLETADGYGIDYYGMSPQVSAMARFGEAMPDSTLSEFGFFFLFPYTSDNKDKINSRQVMFSGSLLQEMEDIGADMGVNVLSPDIFEVVGNYASNYVNLRLIDDEDSDRYILLLSVEPDSFAVKENLTDVTVPYVSYPEETDMAEITDTTDL